MNGLAFPTFDDPLTHKTIYHHPYKVTIPTFTFPFFLTILSSSSKNIPPFYCDLHILLLLAWQHNNIKVLYPTTTVCAAYLKRNPFTLFINPYHYYYYYSGVQSIEIYMDQSDDGHHSNSNSSSDDENSQGTRSGVITGSGLRPRPRNVTATGSQDETRSLLLPEQEPFPRYMTSSPSKYTPPLYSLYITNIDLSSIGTNSTRPLTQRPMGHF